MFLHDDYHRLVKTGRSLNQNVDGRQEIRIGFLADHATQQFSLVLKAALYEQGFFARVYEAEYNTAAFEAFDPGSELYASGAEVVIFSTVVQKYRDRFLSAKTPEERATLPQHYLGEILAIVDALLQSGLKVMVSNFALPLERMCGSIASLSPQSLYGSVQKYNALLIDALSKRSGCLLNDVQYLANRVGAMQFFDERLWIMAKYPCSTTVLGSLVLGVAQTLAAHKGHITKCLVLDLDNTLWGGVIGDDGPDGIALGGNAVGESYQLFQKYILCLKQRGYVLAVCSKNSEETALEVFKSHPEMILREDDIAIFVANWNDKASNIEYIAKVLNLGLDSFIFIDDSPFERDLVRTALPSVKVPEMPEDVSDYISAIELSGLLEATGISEQDFVRNQQYREEALRTTEQIKSNSIDEYLASLNMKIGCNPFNDDDIPRVAQLLNRSNQFNLCKRRFSESDCEKFRRDAENYVTVQARLSDKFGDYGLISVVCCSISDSWLHITEYVMSCRVLRRGVEEYLMNYLFDECKRRGLRGIVGQYIKTPKNGMVSGFYQSFGFEALDADERSQTWCLAVEDYSNRVNFIGNSENV